MLNEEMHRYTELSGNNAEHESIRTIGAYLDGYDKGVADVRENVKGKWIHEYDHEVEEVKFYPPGEGRFYAHCSNCGYYAEYEHDMTKYCPNCGADMRGEA